MTLSLHAFKMGDYLVCRPDDRFIDAAVSQVNSPVTSESSDLIFLVDSSGSMSYIWPFVVDSVNKVRAKRPRTHILKWADEGHVRSANLVPSQYDCASIDEAEGTDIGFGTNITAAVEILYKHLLELRSAGVNRFTVVLISDGDGSIDRLHEVCKAIRRDCVEAFYDNEGQRFESEGLGTSAVLEFTTLGVGSLFPTRIAMLIRKELHNGRTSIPLVSIVKENGDFDEALNGLEPFFVSDRCILNVLEPSVLSSPWSNPESSIEQEMSYIVSQDTKSLVLAYSKMDERSSRKTGRSTTIACAMEQQPWSFDILLATARQWTWSLQSMSLDASYPADIIQRWASLALTLFGEAEQTIHSELEQEQIPIAKSSVLERMIRKRARTNHFVLHGLCKELRVLANGTLFAGLSDEEMAQRLAIGTMEGKYHQRAVEWKGIDSNEFLEFRDEFATLLGNSALVGAVSKMVNFEVEAGLRSAISLECNAEIICQAGLKSAISKMPSQYFMLDVLPVAGLAVEIERSNASMINPWAVRVRSMASLSPVVDTVSLLALDSSPSLTQGISASLSVGENEKETFNAICCIVGSAEHAAAMRPFVTSRLYQILHTYCTCGNVDVLDRSAHIALLSAVLCYMLDGQARGQLRQEWSEKVQLSIRELYPKYSPQNRSFLGSLVSHPNLAMVTSSPEIETMCESTSKVVGLCLAWKNLIEPPRRKMIVENLCKEWFGRAVGHRREVRDWFSLTNFDVLFSDGSKNITVLEMVRDMTASVSLYQTTSEIFRTVRGQFQRITGYASYESVDVNEGRIRDPTQLRDGAVSFATISEFCKEFLDQPDWEMSVSDMKRFCFFATQHSFSYDRRVTADPVTDDQIANRIIPRAIKIALDEAKSQVIEAVTSAWYQCMALYHDLDAVRPMLWEIIQQERAARNMADISADELGYREDVGLCRNACMAPLCPHFLQYSRATGQHHCEAAKLTGSSIPAFSIAISSCVQRGILDPEIIFEEVADGRHMLYEDIKKRNKLVSLVADRKVAILEAVEDIVRVYCGHRGTTISLS